MVETRAACRRWRKRLQAQAESPFRAKMLRRADSKLREYSALLSKWEAKRPA